MGRSNNRSIVGQALRKGTVMAFANACIIWLFAYIAGVDHSVWMVVIILAGAVLAYVTAFLEARAMQNAARSHGGDGDSSSDGVDSTDFSDSTDSSDDGDDFVDPGPDPTPATLTLAQVVPTTVARTTVARTRAEATPVVVTLVEATSASLPLA